MAEGLEFDIKANVGQALAALRQVEAELKKTDRATANTASKSMPKLGNATNQATQSLSNMGRVAQDLPFGIIGVANNIVPLIESFQQLSQKSKETGTSLRSNLLNALKGGGGLILAISVLTSVAQFAAIGFGRLLNKKKETGDAAKKLKNDLDQIVPVLAKEFYQVTQLVTALQRQTMTREEQIKVQKELIKIAPEFFGNIDKEKDKINALAQAYFLYKNALTESFRTKAKEKELIKLSEELLRIEQQILKIEETAKKSGAPKGRINLVNEKGQLENINTLLRARFDQQQKYAEISKAINFSQTEFGDKVLSSTLKAENLKEEFIEIEKILNSTRLSKFDPANVGLDTANRRPEPEPVLQTQSQSLAAARNLDFLIKSINFDKQIEQAGKLRDIIDGGINEGIDQFFNALANKQNPFEALIQGVKRLVVELAAAVVKMLLLKVIANAIAPGAGAALDLGSISKIAGRAGFLGGGIPGFATGGFVSQPTMATIAENGPEFVLRPDQLGAIMNMGNGGGFQQISTTITGEQLLILFERATNRKGRNF